MESGKYAAAGGADKDKILYRVFFQKFHQRGVVDTAVEATENKGVDAAEGADGGDGGGRDSGDAIVVPGDALVDADFLHAMAQAMESGKWRAESGKWLARYK